MVQEGREWRERNEVNISEDTELVKGGRMSSRVNDTEMEGIVATAKPIVLFRDGNPVKFKLKKRDY